MLSTRYNEKEDIKRNFNKLFSYISNDDNNRIDTEYFLRDFSDTFKEYT